MANANPPRRSRPASSMTARAAACFMRLGEQRPENALYDKYQRQARPKIAHDQEPPPRHCLRGRGRGCGGGGADAPAARSALGPVDGFRRPTARPLKNRKNSLFGDSTKLVAPSPSDLR